MTVTMNKNSALLLKDNGNLVATVYFRDKEDVDIMTITPNIYMISRNFSCIYFKEYEVRENYLEVR